MWPRHLFAQPWLLLTLATLPILGLLALRAARWRRHDLVLLVGSTTATRVASQRRRRRRIAGICVVVGLALLGLGSASPQWGLEPEQTAPGRDLIVVLDGSRSMFAEQPSRLERCRRALLDLASSLKKRGGHRVALVVFAAHAEQVCPLTQDYDHFREMVQDLLGPRKGERDPRPRDVAERIMSLDIGPTTGDVSGTRFGAGIDGALEARDPRFSGACDILFLSDGDDPRRDRHWHKAAARAREEGIAIHTIGIGEPERDTEVRDPKLLGVGRKPFFTRLHEAPLKDIAQETRGTYQAARTDDLPLGRIYLDHVATLPVREVNDDSLPGYRQRAAWFLLPAFVFLALALFLAGENDPLRNRRPVLSEESVSVAASPSSDVRGNGSAIH